MGEPTTSEIQERLGHSYALDRLWRETIGLPPGDTKEQPLRMVTAILEASGTAYAVIGGVAVQLHSQEPRTTLDIDLAVRTFADIPRDALTEAGFIQDTTRRATIGARQVRVRARSVRRFSSPQRMSASILSSLGLASSTPAGSNCDLPAQPIFWF
jgi:hypothetical protein